MNTPTVSNGSIMTDYPAARRLERDTLVDLADVRPGQVVVDVQSAGGYLSDEIHHRLSGDVTCICVEPCKGLNCRIAKVHTVCEDPIHDMRSLADGSADRVVGLAGLHHSESIPGTIAEALRVLKPGGRFAVCDVILGSPVADWLNGYVDTHCPSGHKGTFISPGQVTALMQDAGFIDVHEEIKDVPWLFDNDEDLNVFFQGLFGLPQPAAEVGEAARQVLNVRHDGDLTVVDWQLIYAHGTKPGAASHG